MKIFCLIALTFVSLVSAQCNVQATEPAPGATLLSANCDDGTRYTCSIHAAKNQASCQGTLQGKPVGCTSLNYDNQSKASPKGQCCLTFMDCQSFKCNYFVCT